MGPGASEVGSDLGKKQLWFGWSWRRDGSISAAIALTRGCKRGEPLFHLTRRGSSAIFAVHDQDRSWFCPFGGASDLFLADESSASLSIVCTHQPKSNPADQYRHEFQPVSDGHSKLHVLCWLGNRYLCTLASTHPAPNSISGLRRVKLASTLLLPAWFRPAQKGGDR